MANLALADFVVGRQALLEKGPSVDSGKVLTITRLDPEQGLVHWEGPGGKTGSSKPNHLTQLPEGRWENCNICDEILLLAQWVEPHTEDACFESLKARFERHLEVCLGCSDVPYHHVSPSEVPPRPSETRALWLLTPLGSMGRRVIPVEQYEELRGLAIAIKAELEALKKENGSR